MPGFPRADVRWRQRSAGAGSNVTLPQRLLPTHQSYNLRSELADRWTSRPCGPLFLTGLTLKQLPSSSACIVRGTVWGPGQYSTVYRHNNIIYIYISSTLLQRYWCTVLVLFISRFDCNTMWCNTRQSSTICGCKNMIMAAIINQYLTNLLTSLLTRFIFEMQMVI